jgi:hypothetical protein
MKVKISTRTVGQHFGTEGVIYTRGKVIATTDTFPYGFDLAAWEAAEAIAEKRGWTIE